MLLAPRLTQYVWVVQHYIVETKSLTAGLGKLTFATVQNVKTHVSAVRAGCVQESLRNHGSQLATIAI